MLEDRNIKYPDGKTLETVRQEFEQALNDLRLSGEARDQRLAQLEQDMISMQSAIAARQSYQQSGGGGGGNGTSLLDWSSFTYEGSFRIPYTYPSQVLADYGGYGGMWYDASNDSIWLTGTTNVPSAWLEVSVPTLVDISSAPISSANVGTLLQSRVLNLSSIPNQTITGDFRLGGMCVHAGKFYAGAFSFYDGSGTVPDAWMVLDDAADVANANVTGLFQIGTLPPAYTAQYVLEIPSGKQAKLGNYTHACGTIAGPIVTRYSVSPSFIAFNPGDIGVTDPTNSGDYLYRVYNTDGFGVGYDLLSHIGGGFIPEGSNCVIFFGDKAPTGETIYYGDEVDFNDPYRDGKGYHTQDGVYTHCYWAYDLDDLEAVKNGSLSYAAVTPYAYGDIDFVKQHGSRITGGVAYDRTNKRFFVGLPKADNANDPYSKLPLIAVYSHA